MKYQYMKGARIVKTLTFTKGDDCIWKMTDKW
jgi:hypothetical protein